MTICAVVGAPMPGGKAGTIPSAFNLLHEG